FFNKGIHYINLPAFPDFIFYKIHNLWPGIIHSVNGSHSLPSGRHFIHNTIIQISIGCQSKGAGNGSCSHNQDMRTNLVLLPQFSPLRYSKLVLLVNDNQPKIFKNDRIFYNSVSTYYYSYFSGCCSFQYFFFFFCWCRTSQYAYLNRQVPKQ